jgi:hypothetical protein
MSMHQAKALRLFASMDAAERKGFIQHLRRYSKPKRLRLKAGFQFLIAASLDPAASSPQSQAWWEAVFPGHEFEINLFRKHQNKLTVAISDYLVERRWHKGPDSYVAALHDVQRSLLLQEILADRGLGALSESLLLKTLRAIDELPEDHEKFAMRYRLAIQQIGHSQRSKPDKPIPHFVDAQQALDIQYVIATLKLEIANRSLQRRHVGQPSLDRIPAALFVLAGMHQASPLAHLYLQLLEMQPGMAQPAAEALLDLVFDAEKKIPPDTWQDLLYLCLNFAISRINSGEEAYRLTVLRIYMRLLQIGALQKDKTSFKHNFINIVSLAFFRDPPQALARFAMDQKAVLEQHSEFKHAVKFFECQRLFAEHNMPDACNCFMKVWFLEGGRNVRYAAGVMLVKTYFELDHIDDLRQFASDLKRIVTKDRAVDQSKKEAYRQFLKGVQVLCNIKFHGLSESGKSKLKALERHVNAEPLMAGREWLGIQIEKLWKRKQ